MNLLNYIFGGQFSARLNMNLRQDKGYSYGYMSIIDWSLRRSILVAGGGVQTAVTKETVIETLKEFEEIARSRPVTGTEFQDAIDGIMRSMPSQFETHHQIVSQLLRLVIFDLPDDHFARFPDRLAELSLEDVQPGRVRPARYRPPQHRNRRRRRRRRTRPQRPRHPHRPHRLRRQSEGVNASPAHSCLRGPTMRLSGDHRDRHP